MRWALSRGTSTGKDPAVTSTVPSGHHTWAELLRLVGAVRQLAFDTSLPPIEAMGRIRDAFRDYENREEGAFGPFA